MAMDVGPLICHFVQLAVRVQIVVLAQLHQARYYAPCTRERMNAGYVHDVPLCRVVDRHKSKASMHIVARCKAALGPWTTGLSKPLARWCKLQGGSQRHVTTRRCVQSIIYHDDGWMTFGKAGKASPVAGRFVDDR